MSDKATLIKEAKELLEDAQKQVLKTLNSETSFLSRLFSGSAKSNLKIAQSSISKAINQIKSLREDEGSAIGKLQKRLGERDESIKKLEQESIQKTKEAADFKETVLALEAKLQELEKTPKENNPTSLETSAAPQVDPKIEANLRETITKLEDKTLFLTEKLEQNKKELKDSGNLVLEFSSRMKRLKAEITSR